MFSAIVLIDQITKAVNNYSVGFLDPCSTVRGDPQFTVLWSQHRRQSAAVAARECSYLDPARRL